MTRIAIAVFELYRVSGDCMTTKRFLVIITFVFCAVSVFAGGQKDLTKKPPGYGVLVIGNDGKLTAVDGIKWTYEIVYLNSADGQEYSIESFLRSTPF